MAFKTNGEVMSRIFWISVWALSAWISPARAQSSAEVLLSTDNAYNPIPSPDGKLIAYVRTGWNPQRGTGGVGRSNLISEVAVISADGNLVTKSAIAEAFISGWTPDGTRLVCYRDWSYFLVSLDGKRTAEGQIPEVAGVQTPFNRPEWVSYSPSLAAIVWSHMVDSTHWTIENPDRTLVSTGSPIGVRAIPSPNGRYVAVYGEYSPTELRVYDTQTGRWSALGKISIHPDGYWWHYLQPSWNPWFANSSRLAFFVGSALVTSTPDSQQKTETVINGQAGLPVPSPDGQSIAFVTAEPRPLKGNASGQFWGNTTVWTIATAAGSTPRAVTQKSDDATYDLSWLNNNTVVFDRIANEVFYQRARIWKATVSR
jgi:Tol biopolymer transport system component